MDATFVNLSQVKFRIQEAAECLASDLDNLHQQMPKAYALFLRAGDVMPTEQMQRISSEVLKCLQSVKQGNYSQVTDDELENAARMILELHRLSIVHSENDRAS